MAAEHAQVGVLARLQRADLVLQPDLYGRCHGRGVHRRPEADAGKGGVIPHAVQQGEGASGDCTVVRACLAVLHRDGHPGDPILAVRATGCLHGIGYQHQPLPLERCRQPDHLRGDMEPVADQFAGDVR